MEHFFLKNLIVFDGNFVNISKTISSYRGQLQLIAGQSLFSEKKGFPPDNLLTTDEFSVSVVSKNYKIPVLILRKNIKLCTSYLNKTRLVSKLNELV